MPAIDKKRCFIGKAQYNQESFPPTSKWTFSYLFGSYLHSIGFEKVALHFILEYAEQSAIFLAVAGGLLQ